jgi:hypothetical protein
MKSTAEKCVVARLSVFFYRLWCVGILQGFVRVGGGVISEFRIAEAKMTFHGMIFGSSQFAMELVRADVRRVLVAHAARVEGFIGNGDGIFAGFGGRFADGKSVFPDEILGFKTHKLHDDAGLGHSTLAAVQTATTKLLVTGGLTEKKGEPVFAGSPFVTRG